MSVLNCAIEVQQLCCTSLYRSVRLPKALLSILHRIAMELLLRHLTDHYQVCGQRATGPASLYAPQPPSCSSRCVDGVVVRRPRVPLPPLPQVLILACTRDDAAVSDPPRCIRCRWVIVAECVFVRAFDTTEEGFLWTVCDYPPAL